VGRGDSRGCRRRGSARQSRRSSRARRWYRARSRRSRSPRPRRIGAGAALQLDGNRAADTCCLPGAAVRVSGVIVTHGADPDLGSCLAALGPQVEELVVIANLPLELELPGNARLVANERPLSFAANVNQGVAETSGELVVIANPDAEPAPEAVRILSDFTA